LWFPGFMISSGLMLILCILMVTFPEKLKKSTLTYKEKRNLRKKKLLSQSTPSNNSLVSQVESNTNFIRNHALPTINELSENVDDDVSNLNLDSISNKVALNSNKIFSIDSVSSNFSSVATHSTTSFSYKKTENKSKPSNEKIQSLNENQTQSGSFKDKLNISKLKVLGMILELLIF
jgi:hypothetical protein